MQIFTLLSLSAAQINWLLSSSSQAAETKCLQFNWVQLGHPMPKRWWIKGPRHLSFCEVSWLRHHQQSCRLPGTGRSGRNHESWACMSRGWEYRNIRISKIDEWKNETLTIKCLFNSQLGVNMHKPPTGFNHVSDAEPGIQLTEVAAMKVLSSSCISRDRFLDKFPTMMHHDFVFKIESKHLILFLKTRAFLHRTPTNAAAPFTKKKGKTSGSSHTVDKDG